MEKETYFQQVGRRKTAVAQVRLMAGNGTIVVDGIPYEERFPRIADRKTIIQPLAVTDNMGKYNITAKTSGGGVSGQSKAISHGIARALVAIDENLKTPLRQFKLLTRDARVKERKKPGLKRARKAPQYTKR